MFDFMQPKNLKVNSKKVKNNRIIENPVLYKNSENPEITFIVDKLIGKKFIEKFKEQFVQKVAFDLTYQILYCFNYKPLESDLKSGVGEFFYENRIDYSKYIKPWSKIITIGRPLYQMTEGNSDLEVEGFYDFIFNKTYFYTPLLQSWVFPIDHFFELVDKDSFKTFFALRQIKECREFKNRPIRIPKVECIIVDNPNQFLEEHKDRECELAWDIETDSLDWYSGNIGCISFSFDGNIGYVLDWEEIDLQLLDTFLKNKFSIGNNLKFDCLFLKKYGLKNIKVDWDNLQAGHYLNMNRSNSLKSQVYYFDTYMGAYDRELDNYKKKFKNLKNYLSIPKEILYDYAGKDAIASYKIYKFSKQRIIENNFKYFRTNTWDLLKYLNRFVFPTINSFIDIEFEGMLIDWTKVKETSLYLDREIKKIKNQIYKAFDIDHSQLDLDYVYNEDLIQEDNINNIFKKKKNKKKFNINSNEKLGILLQERGWEEVEKNIKGIYLVNDTTLKQWIELGHEEAKLILKLHELNTLMKTFVGYEENNSGFFKYRKDDNKVHCNFSVMLADSGRNKCRAPNLTNIPKHGKLAKRIRSFFTVPNEDHILIEADGKSLQLGNCASISRDKKMHEVFNTPGSDLHSSTAQSIFVPHISLEEFKKKRKTDKTLEEYRDKSKAVNFSLIFNTSAKSFATKSLVPNWSEDDTDNYLEKNNLVEKPYNLFTKFKEQDEDLTLIFCKYWAVALNIKDKFFKTYPGVKYWIENTIKFASNNGYVIGPFGAYRLLLPLIYQGKDDEYRKVKNLKNIACNTAVQNFEAVIMMRTLNKLNDYIKENNLKSRIVNNVHDSIVISLYNPELEQIKKVLVDEFQKDIPENNDIPYIIEGEIYKPLDKDNPTYWGFDGVDWRFDKSQKI